MLLTLWYYIRVRQDGRKWTLWRLGILLSLFFAALNARETAVLLPALIRILQRGLLPPAKASAGTPGSASHSASLPHSPSMPGCAPADPFTATGSGAGGTFVQGTPEALFQTHIAPMA
jgi:hypothetical protein